MDSKIFDNKIENSDLQKLISELLIEITNNPKDTTPLFQLSKIYRKQEKFVDVVNTLILVQEIEPDNADAEFEKNYALAIMAESRLDIYECTNTHMDPWA